MADGVEVVRDDRGGGIRDEGLAGPGGAARRGFGSKVAVNRNLAIEALSPLEQLSWTPGLSRRASVSTVMLKRVGSAAPCEQPYALALTLDN